MNVQTADNQLLQIALRIRELRDIVGFSTAEMAARTGITEEQYMAYESGQVDLPFTFLHKAAMAMGVEPIQLLEGRSARLTSYAVNRRDQGLVTAVEDGIVIQNMAALFRKKMATPYWVTYTYSPELQSGPIHTTTHAGQEFDLVVKGTLRVRVGDHEEILHEGDSIYYDSSTPHGMIAVDGQDCTFLAMIMAVDEDVQKPGLMQAGEEPKAKPALKPEHEPLLCEKFIEAAEDAEGRLRDLHFKNQDSFNFAFDIVDEIARKTPEKLAMLHIANDFTERRFTFKDIKDASSQAANYFTSLGIRKGDRVMLVLKRHYQFWFAILGLHKLGAIAIPATNRRRRRPPGRAGRAGGGREPDQDPGRRQARGLARL